MELAEICRWKLVVDMLRPMVKGATRIKLSQLATLFAPNGQEGVITSLDVMCNDN